MPFARGFGVWELVIILVVVMIIFGVGRLPEVGGAMGKAIREFRSSQGDKAGKGGEAKPAPTGPAAETEQQVGPRTH